MLLQYLLLRGKRNRTRGRGEFGDHRTIRKGCRRSGCFATAAIRQHALRPRCNFRRGSDHLGLANLVGVHAHRGALDRLRRSKGILRHRHYGATIYVVDVSDVDVSDINVSNPRVSDVHLADVSLRHLIRRVVHFARPQWEPTNQTAAPATYRDTRAESSTT